MGDTCSQTQVVKYKSLYMQIGILIGPMYQIAPNFIIENTTSSWSGCTCCFVKALFRLATTPAAVKYEAIYHQAFSCHALLRWYFLPCATGGLSKQNFPLWNSSYERNVLAHLCIENDGKVPRGTLKRGCETLDRRTLYYTFYST